MVCGNIDAMNMRLTQDATGMALEKLTVKRWIRGGTRILAAGGIGAVCAAGMSDTDVYAGYVAPDPDNDVTGLPTLEQVEDDQLFDVLGAIERVKIKGVRDANRMFVDSFLRTNIAAAAIGSLHLAYAELDDTGVADEFGATCLILNKYQYRDADTSYTWTCRMGGTPLDCDNLVVRALPATGPGLFPFDFFR